MEHIFTTPDIDAVYPNRHSDSLIAIACEMYKLSVKDYLHGPGDMRKQDERSLKRQQHCKSAYAFLQRQGLIDVIHQRYGIPTWIQECHNPNTHTFVSTFQGDTIMFNKNKPTNVEPKAQPKTQSKPQPANTTKQIITVGDEAVEITITTRPVAAPTGTKKKRGDTRANEKRTVKTAAQPTKKTVDVARTATKKAVRAVK